MEFSLANAFFRDTHSFVIFSFSMLRKDKRKKERKEGRTVETDDLNFLIQLQLLFGNVYTEAEPTLINIGSFITSRIKRFYQFCK